jgi:hypothetical protein
MANKLVIYLDDELAKALLTMAQANERTPVKQVVWVLREEAKRQELLQPVNVTAQAQGAEHAAR